MSISAFLAVWVATWALCWWPLARVWPSVRVRVGTMERDGFLVDEQRTRGARYWAPLIATVVAFAAGFLI